MADNAFHTFIDYPLQALTPGIIIPQHVAKPAGSYPQHEPIRFVCNGKLGIRLNDALNSRFAGLQNANQPVPLVRDGATAFTFAIHWPGYGMWQKSGNSATSQLVPLKQIATIVANLTQFYLRKTIESGVKSSEPTIGWEIVNVNFDSLFLLELRNIGGGAWQPVLCREMT